MSGFDPIKAQREIVTGMTDIHKVFLTRLRDDERRMSEAEAHFNATRAMESLAKQLLTEAQAKLRALQEAAER